MEEIILEIAARLRAGETVDDRELVRITHAALRRAAREGRPHDKRSVAKRGLLPFYQRVKRDDPECWEAWGITPDIEDALMAVLRVKPRRTASGVATITVITKPWPCSGDCVFCPSDLRCPKSYLHGEPACERAEQNWYDPYLQVSARLMALSQMGHAVDKVELIVLGGTWSDYPRAYQVWFVRELFRALNDGAVAEVAANPMLRGFAEEPDGERACRIAPRVGFNDGVSRGVEAEGIEALPGAGTRCVDAPATLTGDFAVSTDGPAAAPAGSLPPEVARRRALYRAAGLPQDEAARAAFTAAEQRCVDAGERTYNEAWSRLYGASPAWRRLAREQVATLEELELEHRRNESARHRVVGLVIETRPDAVTPSALELIRRLGCTKVQMGVQSTCARTLAANGRGIEPERIARSFELLRAFGFKIHAHAMANLLGATPERDKADYRRLFQDPAFRPDELKLYPCALIGSSRLRLLHERGEWRPYTEDELLDVLAEDVLATPSYCRISRMIRDFSSTDILVGNKKPNLRQLVERRLVERGEDAHVAEVRFREVGTGEVDVSRLRLDEVAYATSNTEERFLQWVAPDGRIAGFCRLSLPSAPYVEAHAGELPVRPGEAMIREVHVYGAAARLGEEGRAAQHLGLGRKLVERARTIAREAGYARVNVISAVGTRAYYRLLGFQDEGLYQVISA